MAERSVIKGSSFITVGRLGCVEGRINSQFINLPERMAAEARATMGVDRFVSVLWVLVRGGLFGGAQSKLIVSRAEYAVVKNVARAKIRRINKFVGLNRSISRIKSFE